MSKPTDELRDAAREILVLDVSDMAKWQRDAVTILTRLVAAAEERAEKRTEAALRNGMWRNHGCPVMSLYGDDGEMQCGECVIDFKRATPAEILRAIRARGGEGK